MPSSPTAVAGSSGAVLGVLAEPTEDVAVALPPLVDLLLGVVAPVPDGVRLADRLGGTCATVGATAPTVVGVTAAEVMDDCAGLPATEAGANAAGDAG